MAWYFSPDGQDFSKKITKIPPNSALLIESSIKNGGYYSPAHFPGYCTDSNAVYRFNYGPVMRHGNKSNYSFFDGHVAGHVKMSPFDSNWRAQ